MGTGKRHRWQPAFIDIDFNEWNHMPKELPGILTDWYYLSKVPSHNVPLMLEVGRFLLSTKRCVETLKVYPEKDGLSALCVQWKTLIKAASEDEAEIRKRLNQIRSSNINIISKIQ
ncbi:hypothetical protein MICA_873 [Micavibrio aeruginosavorus ARL-13]|uniref:Uncharacterized protein n=1 Tax=Micavibrio aeruginosavorus (strain ARL-13) TaxID=856793 RepID=G2KRF9_MICAA|nr:hypothetical protein MICA_873 [Micavibrio aeruginosavorus ARL-13]